MIYKLSMLLICILLAAAPVAAQDEDIEATLYQTVNVRSGPDTRFEIVQQVKAGDQVQVVGRGDDDGLWLQVELAGGALGWVPSYLLIFEGDVTTLPLVGALPDEGEEQETEGPGVVIVTAYGTVNVRSGPSIIEDIVAQLDIGDQARALARSNERNDWLFVENTALSGWVAYFTVYVQGDPTRLPLRVPDVATDDLVHPQDLITTLFNTRLHAEPALDSETVGVLDFGTEVTPFARAIDPTWIYVGTEALRGWGTADLFDITVEHLEALPTYSEDAVYELVSGEHAEPDPAPTAEAEDEPAAEVTPFIFIPAAEATAEATPGV
jgi:uncharacterized protein YraI